MVSMRIPSCFITCLSTHVQLKGDWLLVWEVSAVHCQTKVSKTSLTGVLSLLQAVGSLKVCGLLPTFLSEQPKSLFPPTCAARCWPAY